jgi:hypothetical protein
MNATQSFFTHLPIHIIILVGGALVACTANTVINADLAGRGAVPANATEVDACKQSCTARSKCAGANPNCQTLCAASSSDDAVAFKKCVDSSTCDPACDATLEAPKPTSDASAPDASAKDASADLPDSSSGGDGLAGCLAACMTTQVLECTDGGNTQCPTFCNSQSPTVRATFASCTAAQTNCSPFLAQCWTPFVPKN